MRASGNQRRSSRLAELGNRLGEAALPHHGGKGGRVIVEFLSDLHARKIDLFLKTQGIDTTTPGGKAMFQMMGVFAEFERSIIQERVRAGLRRA